MPVVPADERRHPGADECWRFDFATPAGDLAGYARLAYHPGERTAWWWAAFVHSGRPLVAIRAHDVPIPPRGTDVRTDGLWASLHCETPLDHWSVGLECFAAAYDDPEEAGRSERGDVVPFGLDLEWEATGDPTDRAEGRGYGQWCAVHGEVLVGDDRVTVDAPGHREHRWGERAAQPERRLAIPPVWRVGEWNEAPVPVQRSPVAVPGRPWVETLSRLGDSAGWVGTPA
jgi:hypothetical protein